MSRIFISYRRADSIAITGRIYDYLVLVFGEDSIFKDVDDIPLGADFRAVLEREVGSCDALLVVIGPQWANVAHKDGRKRLHDATDFVRIEVETGLKRSDILVVPLLVDEAAMPGSDELPESLHNLRYRNAAIVRHDPDFRRDMDRLSKQLQRYFEGSGEVTNYLSQLDALDENAAWSEIDNLLTLAEQAAGDDAVLTAKVNARREYRVNLRNETIAALLKEADDLLSADPPDIEQALAILDKVQALAIHESHFSEGRNRILQIVDEVREREQSLIHERRRQRVEAMLVEVETLVQQDPPDLVKIDALLENIPEIASDDETLTLVKSLESRWRAAAEQADQWRQILEERQQAQLEAEKRQRIDRLLSEAESWMQADPPDTRQAEASLLAFAAEQVNDEALEKRRRAVRQQILDWREADSARRKAEAEEQRRRQEEARRYAQQKFSQSVSQMDARDAEARHLSAAPAPIASERRLSLPRSRGLVRGLMVIIPLVIAVIAVLLYNSANRGALFGTSPTNTPPPIGNLVAGIIRVDPFPPRCFESFTVLVNLWNTGGQPTSSGGRISVQDIYLPTNTVNGFASGSFPVLQPDQATTVELQMMVSAYFNEEHRLVAAVDPDNVIAETDETDNSRSLAYVLAQGECLSDDTPAATVEATPPAAATVDMADSVSAAEATGIPSGNTAAIATLLAGSDVIVFSSTGSSVNARVSDSTDSAVIGQLRPNEEGRVIALSHNGSGWYFVQLRNGDYGWIAPSVVTIQGNTQRLPRIEPPGTTTATPFPTPVLSGVNLIPLPALVSGEVQIRGTTSAAGASSYVVDYSPAYGGTWSTAILPRIDPVTNGIIGLWDTTAVSNGEYILRLSVFINSSDIVYAYAGPVIVYN